MIFKLDSRLVSELRYYLLRGVNILNGIKEALHYIHFLL